MDNKGGLKYYNAILPVYIFLLIFLIILITTTHKEKRLNPKVLAAVEQSFIKNKNPPKWFNFFNDILSEKFIPQIKISNKELENIIKFTDAEFDIIKTIDKNLIYSWSIKKEDFFVFNTEYITPNYKVFLENIIELVKSHSKDYYLKISWGNEFLELDKARVKSIYFLLNDYKIEEILFSFHNQENQKIFIILFPKIG